MSHSFVVAVRFSRPRGASRSRRQQRLPLFRTALRPPPLPRWRPPARLAPLRSEAAGRARLVTHQRPHRRGLPRPVNRQAPAPARRCAAGFRTRLLLPGCFLIRRPLRSSPPPTTTSPPRRRTPSPARRQPPGRRAARPRPAAATSRSPRAARGTPRAFVSRRAGEEYWRWQSLRGSSTTEKRQSRSVPSGWRRCSQGTAWGELGWGWRGGWGWGWRGGAEGFGEVGTSASQGCAAQCKGGGPQRRRGGGMARDRHSGPRLRDDTGRRSCRSARGRRPGTHAEHRPRLVRFHVAPNE
jgi:hypothetical protein